MKKHSTRYMLTAYIILQMIAIAVVYKVCVSTCNAPTILLATSFSSLALIMWFGLTITIYFFKNHTPNQKSQ